MMDSALSVKNASGKTFSLLNDTPFKVNKLTSSLSPPVSPKRKYHCMESGCNKSFTTSGHLARHNRIHTGEKNFHCLHPGCPSRFSRQDNMMQHYRTHLSQKARRPHGRPMPKKPELHDHSYFVRERKIFFQPLVTRPKRSTTMPSLPQPDILPYNRHRRSLSATSPFQAIHFHENNNTQHKHIPTILPPPQQYQQQQQQQQHEWRQHTNQKPVTNLLRLANIVSSFG